MKSIRMSDGSLWTCEYKEEIDQYRITVDTRQNKYEFDLPGEELEYMLEEFAKLLDD